MFLESFSLPIEEEEEMVLRRMKENGGTFGYIDNPYPCGIFGKKGLREISFADVTILCGGNGSGKSTLLNLIARRLELNRIAPYNSGELFDTYASKCAYELALDDEGFRHRIPDGSRIITSDDVFDYMLTVRTNNDGIAEETGKQRAEYARLKKMEYGKDVRFTGMEDYEKMRPWILAQSRSVTRREFIRRTAGSEVRLNSNGETAIAYFEKKLKNDTLYCLDEPENSLSPRMQLRLAELIRTMSRLCGCQFVIATHSPFLLAVDGARIYDLDASPVDIKSWWELENTKLYYEFFSRHGGLFGGGDRA